MIYFIRHKGSDGPIKIGTTRNLRARIISLRAEYNIEPEVLASGPGASAAESSAPLPDASGLATFLRRWPETAHLAERLDPKPGASGKTTFDLGVTIGALEEFVRLIDALSIAHPDMRADADKARGAIPALRAKLRQAAN